MNDSIPEDVNTAQLDSPRCRKSIIQKVSNLYPVVSAKFENALEDYAQESQLKLFVWFLFYAVVGPWCATLISIVPFPEINVAHEGKNPQIVFMFAFFAAMNTAVSSYIFPSTIRLVTQKPFKSKWWAVLPVPLVSFFFAFSIIIFFYYKNDTFPVPMTAMLTSSMTMPPGLILTYFSFSSENRSDKTFQKNMRIGLGCMVLLFLTYAQVFRFLQTLFVGASSVTQLLLSLVFALIRKIVEEVFLCLLSKQQPDAVAPMIFAATIYYEYFLCSILQTNVDWFVALFLVGFDALGNIYFVALIAFSRSDLDMDNLAIHGGQLQGMDTNIIGASITAEEGPRPEDERRTARTSESRVRVRSRNKMGILSIAMMIEFGEVLAPLQFIVWSTIVKLVNPKQINLVAHLSDEDFIGGLQTIAIDAVFEVVMFLLLVLVVWRMINVNLFRMLVYFVNYHSYFILCYTWLTLASIGIVEHQFAGHDPTRKFLWTESDDAIWMGGLCWRLPDQLPEDVEC